MNEQVNLWNDHSEEKEKIQEIENNEFNKKAQNIKGSIVELTAQIENIRKNRRKEVEYILENLRRYELFIKNTHISEKNLEEYKKYFYGNLMAKDNGTLNFGDYSEIAKIVNAQKTTKDFLNIYYSILDSYIENESKRESYNFIKYDRIKRELNKYVYKEEISKIQEVQNKSKDTKLLKENFNKDMETLIGRSTLKMFNNRINIKELNNIQKEILSFYERLKDYQEKNNKNSFRKAFLPPLLKDELRKLSFLIVGSSTQLSKNVKDYINSSIKQEVILSNNEKRLLITKEKAIEFIYSKVDNQILQFLKERKIEVNEYNKEITNRLNQNKYKSSIKNNIAYNLNDLLNNINNTLEDTKEAQKGFSKQINKQNIETKAQRMEYYLKHRDVGLINWEN